MSAEQEPHPKPTGRIQLNEQEIDLYTYDPELPEDPDKQKTCAEHLAEERHIDLRNDFWIGGCKFPEKDAPKEESVMITQLACKGLKKITGRCGLHIKQFDTEGNEIHRFE